MENIQCIICLESLEVYTINDFILKQPILKSCECVYSIHESCITEWIRNNPTCPYCKEQLYLEHNLHSTDINGTSEGQSISIIHIENENTPLIYVTEIKTNYCIRNVLISICIIIIILLIGNIVIY